MKPKLPCQAIETGSVIHGFSVEKITPVPELHATAYQFSHAKTGARVMHLFADDPDNLFCVAFRTPVYDNTGVPHILEHSVLGGSHAFPIRDPFQEMLKGSLQTFLNALTYRDKTIYPVSSQVEKDFFNLVDVYCDAVFHPLLTEYTFNQEGWHFHSEGPDKPVDIRGIVFNEMKGVFSDFASHVGRKTVAGLLPETTYAFESGGEPEHIVELTYEAFLAFHRRYYHPSNSYIFLYGNIPSESTLSFIGSRYIDGFDRIEPASAIAPQKIWDAPRRLAFEAPSSREDDGYATVLLSWLFADAVDPAATFCGTILSHYLLGAESSPLKRALVDSGLGEDLDDMSGFGIDAVQSTFCVGLRKSRPENAEEIERVVLSVLREQVEEGMDMQLLDGALRQVEFHLREIGGGHFPYHLRLADRCYNAWLYDGDPLAHLAFEQPLAAVKEELAGGDRYFRDLLRTRLVENPHRLLSVITASAVKGEELQRQNKELTAHLTASFSDEDRARCRKLTQELVERQTTPPSPAALAALPRLGRDDLPAKSFDTPFAASECAGTPFYQQPLFSAGIVYADIGFDLSSLPDELLPYLPLYLEILHRCGTSRYSFEQMATRIALSTGGISASTLCRTATSGKLFFAMMMHGKSLLGRVPEMMALMQELLTDADLSNVKQIRDILFEERNQLSASVIQGGHSLAMLRAGAGLAPSRAIEERLGGISQLRFLDRLASEDRLEKTVPVLRRLHAHVVGRAARFVSVTADEPESIRTDLDAFIRTLPASAATTGSGIVVDEASYQETSASNLESRGIEINAAVNFAARAWRLGPFDPVEYGRCFLLARHLSTGYLWDKIRVEGGAYGGLAVMSTAHPLFSCASYRDPNCAGTLRHFEGGLQEVADGIPAESLDISVIGAIGKIDHPKPPHQRGLSECLDRLCGCTPEVRQRFREGVLTATPAALAQTARKILGSRESRVVVLGSGAAFDAAAKEGATLERESLLPG